jgi:hypothetical protein
MKVGGNPYETSVTIVQNRKVLEGIQNAEIHQVKQTTVVVTRWIKKVGINIREKNDEIYDR